MILYKLLQWNLKTIPLPAKFVQAALPKQACHHRQKYRERDSKYTSLQNKHHRDKPSVVDIIIPTRKGKTIAAGSSVRDQSRTKKESIDQSGSWSERPCSIPHRRHRASQRTRIGNLLRLISHDHKQESNQCICISQDLCSNQVWHQKISSTEQSVAHCVHSRKLCT